MAKKSSQYACGNCGAVYSAWSGKCTTCGEWNTISEEALITSSTSKASKGREIATTTISGATKSKDAKRIITGIDDVDLVLGGGIVQGSVSLMAGQPGIGKSTLLLQIASAVSNNHKTLYISGEESAHQISLRAKRLGLQNANLILAISNDADDIAMTIARDNYDLVVVDSIQTISTGTVATAPGTVSQITNCAAMLISIAKRSDTAVIMVGHVTKEGAIAGPKVLEHVVDTVLQLEGDRYGGFKILRSTKNRFGSTNEAGIFEMQSAGLVQVDNPSEALLSERQITDGSVVLATMEGTRPLLVEVQALVNKTSYGYPKRACSGMELNRLNLLIAMLERRTKLKLADMDVYINIVGGMKITDPAADLAVCMAIGSACKGLQLKANAVVYGEVGLSGEVRHVPFAEKRIAEAKKMGFEVAIGPNTKNSKQSILSPVRDVRTALNTYLES